jgi:uncharacterized protein YecE (DUF72 family)
MILLGTSGFSYDDWIGTVYPPDLPRRMWLPFIAKDVDAVELNVTYYRVPGRRTVEGWVERTPPNFRFAVKAHGSLTHEREDPQYEPFRQGIAPLIESGKMGAILAQFPFSFHPTPENREYLLSMREGFQDLPVVVEFRDSKWVRDETFDLLDELRFGFCCVDEPPLEGLMPPVARAVGTLGYVRLHGRNAAKWWRHEKAWERYDYTYSEEELREWVPKLQQLDAEVPLTLVFANNHYRGQSLDAIHKLRRLLDEASVSPQGR